MKILIVDDEQNIRELLKDYLENEGYTTHTCKDGLEAVDYVIVNQDIDLILLDVRMPQLNGYETLEAIRDYSDVPVVFLTALNESLDEIKGLDLGADDYITKPFTYAVLTARLRSLLRRQNKNKVTIYTSDTLTVALEDYWVKIDGTAVELTIKEFDLLKLFIEQEGQTLERLAILDKVWGYEYDGDPRTVDTHIKTLRAKLKRYGSMIKTIRGVGYRFED